MAPPIGGVDKGGRRRALSFTDMAAISGSWVSYIFTSRANLRTPAWEVDPEQLFLLLEPHTWQMYYSCVSEKILTFPFIVEPISLDDFLLNLCSHRKHQLKHLAHVVTGALSCLLHPSGVFWYREGLDHFTQHHWLKKKINN